MGQIQLPYSETLILKLSGISTNSWRILLHLSVNGLECVHPVLKIQLLKNWQKCRREQKNGPTPSAICAHTNAGPDSAFQMGSSSLAYCPNRKTSPKYSSPAKTKVLVTLISGFNTCITVSPPLSTVFLSADSVTHGQLLPRSPWSSFWHTSRRSVVA